MARSLRKSVDDQASLNARMPKVDKHEKREPSPPGHFVSEDQRTQTARFLAELRKRRLRDKTEEPKLGPPP